MFPYSSFMKDDEFIQLFTYIQSLVPPLQNHLVFSSVNQSILQFHVTVAH